MPIRFSPKPIQQRQAAPARIEGPAQVFGQRSGGQGQRRAFQPSVTFAKADYLAAVEQRQGVDRRRRFHAGAGGPAHQEALYRERRCRCTARCARSIPVALHVLLPFRRLPRRGRFARDPGAPGTHRRRVRKSPSARSPVPSLAAPPPRSTRRWSCELVNDPKERAEHVMLIDLARNDIGRIAKTGTCEGDRGLCGGTLQPRDAPGEQCGRHPERRHDQRSTC
jgi:hypothetical protein